MTSADTYYAKDYYAGKCRPPDYLIRTIVDILKSHGVNRLLEVGCGTGYLLRLLRSEGFSCFGCDISFYAARESGQINANAASLPLRDESMDAVLIISVIEHLDSRGGQLLIEEAMRIIRKKGVIFLVTPNVKSLKGIFCGGKKMHTGDPTHITFYSPFSLSAQLTQAKFGNIRHRFPAPKDCSLEGWSLPKTITSSRSPVVRNLVNWLFISSPLSLLRDSFWILAEKP